MPDQPSAVSGAFRRPFAEQVAFFRQKLGNLVPTQRWDDVTGAAHDTAFMVAGAQKADLLMDLATSVDRAISQGTSLEAFRKDFGAAVDKHDWHGWTGEDTKGGRAWRTRTIYRTNTYTAYSAGRRAQLEAENYPLWVYRHGGSKDPRPEHLHVFNGLVLPPSHPFWRKFYPPSDWGCSCYVVGARSERGARRLGGDPDKKLPEGWDAIDPSTGEPAGIGPGWGYAPGESVVQAVIAKVRDWDGPIATAFLDDLPVRLRLMIVGQGGVPSPITAAAQLTDAERAAFHTYTGNDFTRINREVREGGEPAEAVTMTDVLDRCSFPEEVIVYRGVRDEYARKLRDADLEPGDEINDRSFLSTSRLLDVAEQFRSADEEDGVLIVITLPRGARALDVSSISKYGPESEIIVQRRSKLKVVSWDAENRILHVEPAG